MKDATIQEWDDATENEGGDLAWDASGDVLRRVLGDGQPGA